MEQRQFGPKRDDHPTVGIECPVCKVQFRQGDFTTLVTLGVDNDEDRRRRDAGQPFNGVAAEVHWDCRP